METAWNTAVWQQCGATIDMLENALLACPSAQWTGRLWRDHSDSDYPPSSQYAAFWSITHHTLFWLDFYLTGSLEGFAPPTPFTVDEEGAPTRLLPEQPYTQDELHAYLVSLRQKCQDHAGWVVRRASASPSAHHRSVTKEMIRNSQEAKLRPT